MVFCHESKMQMGRGGLAEASFQSAQGCSPGKPDKFLKVFNKSIENSFLNFSEMSESLLHKFANKSKFLMLYEVRGSADVGEVLRLSSSFSLNPYIFLKIRAWSPVLYGTILGLKAKFAKLETIYFTQYISRLNVRVWENV